MSNDETDGAKPELHGQEVLLYDFLKFLTTLGILVLGGILNLALANTDFSPKILVPVTAIVTLACLSALGGAAEIVKARQRSVGVPRSAYLMCRASMLLFGIGLGSFLMAWLLEIQR